MLNAEGLQRIENRVHHRRRSADRAGLADALDAERIGPRRHFGQLGNDVGHVLRARHRVVEEAPAEELPGLRIVGGLLAQRLAHALRNAAVNLSLADHRIDDHAEIVHGGEAVDVTAPVSGSTSTSHTWHPFG